MYYVEARNGLKREAIHDPYSKTNNLKSGSITLVLNAISDFNFTILYGHPLFNELKVFKTIITIYDKNNKIVFKGRIIGSNNKMCGAGSVSKTFVVESELAYLLDTSPREIYITKLSTPKQFIEKCIEAHNRALVYKETISDGTEYDTMEHNKRLYLGEVDVQGDISEGIYGNVPIFEHFKKYLLEPYKGYINIRYEEREYASGGKYIAKYIDYLQDSGKTNKMSIALAKNLKSIESEEKSSQIATRIIPLGCEIHDGMPAMVDGERRRVNISARNRGKDYLDDKDLIKEFGLIEKVVLWDDVGNHRTLYEKGIEWLKNQKINNSISISAIDLSLIDESYDSFVLGDNYKAYNPLIDIDKEYQLIEKVIDIVDPIKSSLTFGDKQLLLTGYDSSAIGIKNDIKNLRKNHSDLVETIEGRRFGDNDTEEYKDLNNIVTSGKYYCDSYDICNSIKNCPVENMYFSLEVSKVSRGENPGVLQTLMAYNDKGVFNNWRRLKIQNTWNRWTRG